MTVRSGDAPPRIRRTHIALSVTDPAASAPWYEDVLGMQVTARTDQWVFLSFGNKHHDIALIRAEPTPDGVDPRGAVNLQHYGLEIEGDVRELRRLYGALLRKNVPVVKTTDHKSVTASTSRTPTGTASRSSARRCRTTKKAGASSPSTRPPATRSTCSRYDTGQDAKLGRLPRSQVVSAD